MSKKTPRWTGLLIGCATLKVGESFTLEISEALIGRFRAIVRVSGRTSRWRWTVRKTYLPDHSIAWQVTKVGLWPSLTMSTHRVLGRDPSHRDSPGERLRRK